MRSKSLVDVSESSLLTSTTFKSWMLRLSGEAKSLVERSSSRVQLVGAAIKMNRRRLSRMILKKISSVPTVKNSSLAQPLHRIPFSASATQRGVKSAKKLYSRPKSANI